MKITDDGKAPLKGELSFARKEQTTEGLSAIEERKLTL